MTWNERLADPGQAAHPGLREDHIFTGLVHAMDWFDNGLQNALAARGFARVHRTQSMILVHIARGVTNPARIAREMGSTRQNIHHMAKALIEADLIEQQKDPRDLRRSVLVFKASAAPIRSVAVEILEQLEETLAERLGRENLGLLRKLLGMNWGSVVSS